MKYFINGIPHDKWMKNLCLYWDEFEKIKEKLHVPLAKVFSSGQLHDSEITAIHFENDRRSKKTKYNVTVSIKNDEFSGDFVHYNVHEFRHVYQGDGKNTCVNEYMYGEILIIQDLFTHNFTLSAEGEVFIKCEKIKFLKAYY